MSIVAHIDDDLLFQNPDIINAIEAGGGHTTVYLTAGDAGRDMSYVEAREAGAKAAYTEMTGYDDWVDETVQLTNGTTEFSVQTSYLASQPDIRLYFLRLPDGNLDGSGFPSNDHESVEELWEGSIQTVTTTDGANTYTADDVSGLLLGLMEIHQPDALLLHDLDPDRMDTDHSDHFYTAQFSFEAHQYYDNEHELNSYIGYSTSEMPANLDDEDAEASRDAFYAYVHGSGTLTQTFDQNGDPVLGGPFDAWPDRQYLDQEIDEYEAGGVGSIDLDIANAVWSADHSVRTTGDLDGDGRADLIGFGQGGVMETQSGDGAFQSVTLGPNGLGYAAGRWHLGRYDHDVADVNGDGLDDLIGFGASETIAAISNGDGTFSPMSSWSSDYASDDGWDAALHERMMADVNGDGLADIVAFGDQGTEVALSTGSGFEEGALWIDDFGRSSGWRADNHERVLADVNGDGMDDIVGFGRSGVLVSTSNGAGFDPAELVSTDFSTRAGWREDRFERDVADVDGDGMADVVAFGPDGVQVSLANGNGFDAPQLWSDDYGNGDGWSQGEDTRSLADVNGDGMADILAFGSDGAQVSLSDGTGFADPYDGSAPFPTMEVVDESPEALMQALFQPIEYGTQSHDAEEDDLQDLLSGFI